MIKERHTLDSLIFTYSKNQNNDSSLIPSKYLIYTNESCQSLTVLNCLYNSMFGIIDNQASFIQASRINKIKINNFTLQNATIAASREPILIRTMDSNESVYIQDCYFNNINIENLNHSQIKSVLYIENQNMAGINITGCVFNNCTSQDSISGALYINDSNQSNRNSFFIINNNTFSNNKGNYSGGIFINLYNPTSDYSFNNNYIFSNNSNKIHQGIGKDTYLNFTDSRKDWTPGNILNKIEDMFKNSISNSSNDSIYFESYRFNLIYVNGSITLPSSVPEPSPPKPNPEEQKGLSLREVVRISIGSVCLVVIAITIIIIIVVSRQV